MAKKNIVVVGAGYAGVSATKYMAKKLKKDNDVEITLIDRHSYHTLLPWNQEPSPNHVPGLKTSPFVPKIFLKASTNQTRP